MTKILLVASVLLNLYLLIFSNHENRSDIFKDVQAHEIEVFNKCDSFFLIDCRSKFTYDKEHAKGSVNLSLLDVVKNPVKVLALLKSSKNKDLLIYCSGSNCNTSQKVAEYLRYSGKNIYIYKGGWSMMREFLGRDKITNIDNAIH